MTQPKDSPVGAAPRVDVAIIGGGIAGAAAASFIAPDATVALLEQERELAYHTTSRSAAIYLEADVEAGEGAARLGAASLAFFRSPPVEVTAPLLSPTTAIDVGPESMHEQLASRVLDAQKIAPRIELLDAAAIGELCPVLDPRHAAVALYDPAAANIDVMALHQVYLRIARGHGATVIRGARVERGEQRKAGHWVLSTSSTETPVVHAGVVVNAAGAWGDEVAARCGVAGVGLEPKRRTAFTSPVADFDPSGWPFVYSADPNLPCYFKPEAGQQLLCSLSDETPDSPHDVRPEEIDIARAIDHLNTLTRLGLRSVKTSWAGLRTFAPDRTQVLGFDDAVDGFCWMVGQGGTGILTSAAAGMLVASILTDAGLPPPLRDHGIDASIFSRDRFPT